MTYSEDMFMAVGYAFNCLIVMPLGIIIGIKLYNNVKNEEHLEKGKVFQGIMKNYVVVQCVAWPLISILVGVNAVLDRMHMPIRIPILKEIMSSYRFLYLLTLSYVGFNSLLVAISRYIFIVFVQHHDTFTIKRIRKWLTTASVVVPILVAVFHEATDPSPEKEIWSDTDDLDDNILEDVNITVVSNEVNRSDRSSVPQSYLFMLVDEHVPAGIKALIEFVCTAMKVAIFSNILEGCIYAHIFIYCRLSENKDVIDALLSEESRVKRNRTKTINLQMTALSWAIEFVTGLLCMIQLVRFDVQEQIHKSATFYAAMSLSTIFLSFIVIPITYLLNTEVCKAVVVARGWWSSFLTLVVPNRAFIERNSVQDVPDARYGVNDAMSQNANHDRNRRSNDQSHSNPIPQSIPTISGNINAREQKSLRKVLRNNYIGLERI